jgi:hypothetical protein
MSIGGMAMIDIDICRAAQTAANDAGWLQSWRGHYFSLGS